MSLLNGFKDMDKQKISVLTLALGLVAGIGASLAYDYATTVTGEEAAGELISVLESQADQELELVNVEKESGVYEIDLSTQEGALTTYHVTRDGALFTPAMQSIEEVRTAIESQTRFYDCLEENNVVVYGDLTQQETSLQLQILGGGDRLLDLYRDVNDEEVMAEAENRGIEAVPSIYMEGNVLEGVSQLDEVEEFTGCSLE